ncbi:hypothetical protein, partial [Enterobacter asburiae]|uniref:hypothetical protein n=1 Tax=Enterobacter asburiae TaxID=61645 RepID=UPI003F56F561
MNVFTPKPHRQKDMPQNAIGMGISLPKRPLFFIQRIQMNVRVLHTGVAGSWYLLLKRTMIT